MWKIRTSSPATFVIDFVRVPRQCELTDIGFIGRRGHVRESGEPPDMPLDGGFYVLCGRRLPLFEILVNFFKVGMRANRIPDSHPP